jgi:hypothetical protein
LIHPFFSGRLFNRRSLASGPTPFRSGNFARASVATQLVPLLSEHVGAQTDIRIVGSYGDYSMRVAAKSKIDVNQERWVLALKSWLEVGARINYLLVAATEDGRQVLERLATQFKDFHLWEITADDIHEPVDKAYVKELMTFHPVLLENKKKKIRAMWIENDHQPGSTEAENCDWIAPDDAKNDPRFDDISKLVNDLIERAAAKKERLVIN